MGGLLYRFFARTHRVAGWFRRRFTPAGLLALAVMVLAAAAGADTQASLAYQLFCLAGALLLVAAGAVVVRRLPAADALIVRRDLARIGTVGRLVDYTVTVRNTGRRTLSGLQLCENTGDARPDRATWFAALGTLPRKSGLAAARVWRELLARRVPGGISFIDVPPLAPGASVTLRLRLSPSHRGRVSLAGLWLARRDPLGLMRGLRHLPLPARLLVLPERHPLPTLNLPGVRVHQPGGVTYSSGIGDSEEFQGLRDYRPGDPLQHIHWKSFARTGRPIVKEFESEFFERHALVLDTCTGAPGDVLEAVVAIGASFACTVDTRESLLDLLLVLEQTECLTAGRGQRSSDALLETLAQVEPAAPAAFAHLADGVRQRRHLLSSCILVLVGRDAARLTLVADLRRSGLAVLALCVEEQAPSDAQGLVSIDPRRPGPQLGALAAARS